MLISALLLLIFSVHLLAFAYLGLRRRQGYYVALVVTFGLLSAAMAARLFAPDAMVAADVSWAGALRMAAWPAAAVSIAWTVGRIVQRRRSAPAD